VQPELPPNPAAYPPLGREAARIFTLLDSDGNETLDMAEVNKLRQKQSLLEQLQGADKSHDGKIDMKEWLVHVQKLCKAEDGELGAAMLLHEMEEELMWKPTLAVALKLWSMLDRDGSGEVDEKELKAIKTYGYLRGEDIKMEYLDMNKDGKLQKSEFMAKVREHFDAKPTMCRIFIEGAIKELERKARGLAIQDGK